MPPPTLPYVDGLLAAYRAGQAGRDLHLGYWDDPPPLSSPGAAGEFTAAQARLTERISRLSPLRSGQRVLDIACGLGGTLAQLAQCLPELDLIGLNIDERQLAICREIAPSQGCSLALVEGDACAPPFPSAAFDHVFCIEAMFHFASRQTFVAEAARLLRRGGYLILSDILLHPGSAAMPWDLAAVEAILHRDYGPWPEPWIGPATMLAMAAAAGLELVVEENWTANTLPSYRIIAPGDEPAARGDSDAGSVLRWMHVAGQLTYQVLVFRRR